MKNPIFKVGNLVFYYNKWNNEIEKGEILNIRQAHLNWDYNIRYQIYTDFSYTQWIEEKYLGKEEQVLFKFLV